MTATWADVQHQALRCRRLQDPAAKRSAGKLWFQLCREALAAGTSVKSKKQEEHENDPGTRNGSVPPIDLLDHHSGGG
jgi:hypothetical protein